MNPEKKNKGEKMMKRIKLLMTTELQQEGIYDKIKKLISLWSTDHLSKYLRDIKYALKVGISK